MGKFFEAIALAGVPIEAATTKRRMTGTNNTTQKAKKEGGVAKKHQVFVSKNIVTKKQNPQQSLKRYFKVTNGLGRVEEKNFQGFPLGACVYEEEVGKYVYHPAQYMSSGTNKENARELCHDCYLRPCLTRARWEDIVCLCKEVTVSENLDDDALYVKMMDRAKRLLVEIFGCGYEGNHEAPGCVGRMISRYHSREKMGSFEEEDSFSDDGLAEGSIDYAEYS